MGRLGGDRIRRLSGESGANRVRVSMGKNVLVLQSGGCTPVMNHSLAALVQELLDPGDAFGPIYGAVHALDGILDHEFLDLRRQPRDAWTRISNTPGAALGSGRRSLHSEEVPQVVDTLSRHDIGYLFTIGGNDSAGTAQRLALDAGLVAIHIPKTIDNDLVCTDHTPGYGSAARFVALANMGAGKDAESMGQASPITVMEVMGRDAGWLAALGKGEEMDAPHYICLPEVPLDEANFLKLMEDAYRRWGFAVAVTAENARGPKGPVGQQGQPYFVDDFGHRYFEGPARYLAQLLSQEMKVRVRYEKPGTIQRSLMACLSRTDAKEAQLVGRAAVGYALDGRTGSMVTLEREPGAKYRCTTGLAPLAEVAGRVKLMPPEYIDASSGMVTKEYLRYARPLLGSPLPRYARLVRA